MIPGGINPQGYCRRLKPCRSKPIELQRDRKRRRGYTNKKPCGIFDAEKIVDDDMVLSARLSALAGAKFIPIG